MKLIDILLQELPNRGGWPEGVHSISQFPSGELCYHDEENNCSNANTGIYLAKHEDGDDTDWAYGIYITREQYESALAAKNDGWIEWGGGECPVEKGALVDVKYRNGEINQHVKAGVPDNGGSMDTALAFRWSKLDEEYDIISYRLRKPQEVTEDNDESDLNECIGQDVAPVWSGEGLPPVGCECEYQYKVHGSEWCPLECVAVDGKAVFGWSNNTPVALRSNTHNFRPLRSEVDKKREEAIMSLAKSGGAAPFKYGEKLSDGQLLGSMWYELYDAIAAGKVRGVKLED